MAIVALAAASVTAQTEEWRVYTPEYTLKTDVYVANPVESEMSVVKFATDNVEGTHTAGPISKYTQGPDLPLVPQYDNSWENLSNMNMGSGVTPFYFVRGKGNPAIVEKVSWDQIKDKETGDYKENGNTAFFMYDGSLGLPSNGSYLTFKTKVAGELKVSVQIWKDNRDVYVVNASDAKPLAFGTEVVFNGYIDGDKWTAEDGLEADDPLYNTPKLHENMQPIGTEGYDAYIFHNKKTWGEFVFNTQPGETYYIFIRKSQIGFGGYEFTPAGGSDGINDITNTVENTDAPVYNLAGQRVGKDAKGILI